jgi:hypothetical protein
MLNTAEHAEGNSLSFVTPPADSVRPMARRASSGTGIGPILLVALIAALVGGGGFWLFKQASDPFRTLQSLDVPAYLDNANSLRGNVYKIEVTIQNSLGWSPTVGRLFAVEVASASGNDILPVLIPAEFNSVNVQKGQRFHFKIEVIRDGLLLVKGLEKL